MTREPQESSVVPSPWRLIGRVLTFRFEGRELHGVTFRHLALGLAFAWLAGVGRYWDNPRAGLFQHLGLGSVAYVLVLSTFLWLLLYPLGPRRWSWLSVATFVAAVSPPALLYAVPVERFMSLEAARITNFWFLALIALWRVVLYAVFLYRYPELRGNRLFVSLLLPLVLIVFGLTALNLEKAVFEIMAGNSVNPGTSADDAYLLLVALSLFSIYAAPVLVLLYVIGIVQARRERGARLTSHPISFL